MLENILDDTVDDELSKNLEFKLESSAKYVLKRSDQDMFTPLGGNSYSFNGSKVIKFKIANIDSMIDPQTAVFNYNLVNADLTAGKTLRPLYSYGFITRMRATCRGVVLTDLSNYNSTYKALDTVFNSKDSKTNNAIEGLGYSLKLSEMITLALFPGIRTSQNVSFNLNLMSVFSQMKHLNMGSLPLELEFHIGDQYDNIVSIIDEQFTAVNTSYLWRIEDPAILASTIIIDSSLNSSYYDHLKAGGKLPIMYDNVTSNYQTVTDPKFQISISHAVSKLNSVFITMFKNLAGNRVKFYTKEWSEFYCGYCENGLVPVRNPNNDIKAFQISVGKDLYPVIPINSYSKAFNETKKCVANHVSAVHSIDLDPTNFFVNDCILGVNFMKLPDNKLSGINTLNQNMILRCDMGTNLINAVNVISISRSLIEISFSGVNVYD
jgi:hypothetical protein